MKSLKTVKKILINIKSKRGLYIGLLLCLLILFNSIVIGLFYQPRLYNITYSVNTHYDITLEDCSYLNENISVGHRGFVFFIPKGKRGYMIEAYFTMGNRSKYDESVKFVEGYIKKKENNRLAQPH